MAVESRGRRQHNVSGRVEAVSPHPGMFPPAAPNVRPAGAGIRSYPKRQEAQIGRKQCPRGCCRLLLRPIYSQPKSVPVVIACGLEAAESDARRPGADAPEANIW